jgi:DNA-binding transcriptional MerR regulator
MYRISDFATLSRVSAKMLRHYDELGLLPPAHIDPETDYRFYTVEQLPRLNRIVVLKDLGFSLEQIAGLLDDDLPVEQLKDMLRERRTDIEQRIQEEQQRLRQVEARLAQLEQAGRQPGYEILLRPISPMLVASAHAQLHTDAELAELLNAVEEFVSRKRARAARPPTVVYHACEQAMMKVEVAIPVSSPLQGVDWVRPAELPGVNLMACLVHTGNDRGLSQACTALHQWIDTHGYQVAGPMRERYLRYSSALDLQLPPAFVASHPDAAMTEIQVPVILASAA